MHSRRLPWIVLVVLLAVVAGRDLSLLLRYPVAAGIDGYYYVLQIDSLKNNHHLYFPTRTPLVLYCLTVINYLTKNSVMAVKVGSVLLHVLLCLGIFALIASATRNHWIGVLASVLAGVSGLHLYMITEFINVLGALTFLVWSGWSAVRWVQSRRSIWIGLAVIFLAGAFFSHQLAVAIALTVVVFLFLFQGLISSKSRGRVAGAAALAVVAIYFAPALLKVQAVIDIPDRLRTELSAMPHWPISQYDLPETLMLAVLASIALMMLLGPKRLQSRSVAGAIVGSIALWSLIVTLNPFLNPQALLTGFAGRLRTLAYVQVALVVPALIWLAYSVQRKLALYVSAALLPLVMLSIFSPLPYGLRDEFLARRERLIPGLKLFAGEVGEYPVVIARHGDQFTVTATVGIPSQQLAPENTAYRNVYWLLDTPKNQAPTLESVVLAEDPTSRTVLVKDTALRSYFLSATDIEKRILLSYNPHLVIAYNRGGPGNPVS